MRTKKDFVQLSVRFPIEMHSDFKEYSRISGLYLNQVIVQMADMGWKTNKVIQKYLEKIYDRLAQEAFGEVFKDAPPPRESEEEKEIIDLDRRS